MDKTDLLKRLNNKADKLRAMALELDCEADFVTDLILEGKEPTDEVLTALFKFCEGKITKKQLTKILWKS